MNMEKPPPPPETATLDWFHSLSERATSRSTARAPAPVAAGGWPVQSQLGGPVGGHLSSFPPPPPPPGPPPDMPPPPPPGPYPGARPRGRCYTCVPRGVVQRLIICDTEHVWFHHDLWQRPLFIVTPKLHFRQLDDMPPELLHHLFRAMDTFMSFWHLTDYQVTVNCGEWQRHDHVHLKVRAPDAVVHRMRQDHLRRVERERERQRGLEGVSLTAPPTTAPLAPFRLQVLDIVTPPTHRPAGPGSGASAGPPGRTTAPRS